MSKTNFSQERMTVVETASYIGVAESTFYNWRSCKMHDLPTPVPVGKRLYYRKSDIDDWLERRQRQLATADME